MVHNELLRQQATRKVKQFFQMTSSRRFYRHETNVSSNALNNTKVFYEDVYAFNHLILHHSYADSFTCSVFTSLLDDNVVTCVEPRTDKVKLYSQKYVCTENNALIKIKMVRCS